MKHSFFLRKPKGTTETLILFNCFFNDEKKKFVYSTKQSILPAHWDFENRQPKNKGKGIANNHTSIAKTLRKYTDEFYLFQSRCSLGELKFDSISLKEHFDKTFGNHIKKSSFFEVYDKFTQEKIKLKEWKPSTIKRYSNIKNLLLEFEKAYKYKLNFNRINKKFYTEFTDYCYEYKNHYTNTFSRNLGLIKTFMFWATKNEYNFNMAFIDFKKPQKVLTREEALSLEQVQEIHRYSCKTESAQKIKDIFIFQCLTGMRYGELKRINKRVISDKKCIVLKEEKNSKKQEREIPLSIIPYSILLKYNYQLPLLSNQKQNDAIKEVIKEIGYTHDVEFTRTKGVEQTTFIKPFYERISTHTARRSFITIMRNNGIADKTIMSISGHKDIKTFNMYHQVDNTARINAVNKVFSNF